MKKLFLFFSILIFPQLTPGYAQETVNILVDVFEGSEQAGKIDPGLAYIREEIKRFPFRYQCYRSLASAAREIPLGQKDVITFVLPLKLSLEITPKSTGKLISLGIRMWEDKKLILTTDVSLARNGTIIVGGPKINHGTLLIAISEGW